VRFAFTRDQELLRDGVREVLARECTPALVRASWESREAANGLWQTLADIGVVGLTVPEEHGGLGLGPLEWTPIFEEHGRFASPLPLVETMAVAAPLLAACDDDELKRRWLPRIARGAARVAIALEPSPLLRDADVADLLLVQRGDVLHLGAAGDLSGAPIPSVDRSRRLFALPSSGLPSSHLLAAPLLQPALDRAALATSAELLGLAARMIDLTVDYAKIRKQFGAAIGSFQAVKHALANALVKLELARPAVYRAAYSVAHADPLASTHVSMAKACASDAATFVARVALQCHGAIGYSFEHDLHLWMKRAWALAGAYGDAPWHRARVARAVVDAPSDSVTQGDPT
jgi:alkylation response protein AidB-like acyl-CoA dehydrogenase